MIETEVLTNKPRVIFMVDSKERGIYLEGYLEDRDAVNLARFIIETLRTEQGSHKELIS